MDIKDLLDSKNTALYDELCSTFSIKLEKGPNDSWGSHLCGTTAIVTIGTAVNGRSSFTHELLHFDTQSKGYRRIKAALTNDDGLLNVIDRLISCLDNEFQHHKMFSRFVSLGYDPKKFYLDKSINAFIEYELSNQTLNLYDIIFPFMTLIAPGGTLSIKQKTILRSKFDSYKKGKFKQEFFSIEILMNEWAEAETYNAETYIIEFFQIIHAGPTWVSYSTDVNDIDYFPSSGFFTGSKFDWVLS